MTLIVLPRIKHVRKTLMNEREPSIKREIEQ